MKKAIVCAAALCAIAAVAACSNHTLPPGAAPQSGNLSQTDVTGLGPDNGYYPIRTSGAVRQLCPQEADPHVWRCFGLMRTDLMPSRSASNSAGIPYGVGYAPSDIQSAYDLNPARGSGQTVFIIDAFGYTTAASDLAKYRAAAALPACTVGNKCLRILNQEGYPKPLPSPNVGWGEEQSLDLDAVSAVCPRCHITLIEATNGNTLGNALSEAIDLHARIVSMSFGGSESPPANPGLPRGTEYVASAGDGGGGLKDQGGPEMPCTYAAVVCAGGTQLTHNGASWSEVVWNTLSSFACTGSCGATGSACSTIVPKPAWQKDAGCRMRSAADVAADASVFTPLAVYNSLFDTKSHPSPWGGVGGTSLSAPLIAATFALAGNAATRNGAQQIWAKHTSLNHVNSGTNVYAKVSGPCASKVRYICIAGPGFNGPTGWGSPHTAADF